MSQYQVALWALKNNIFKQHVKLVKQGSKYIRKKIIAKNTIFKGQKFSENNLTTKRSNTGIPSSNWKKVIGKISNFNFKKDQIIKI